LTINVENLTKSVNRIRMSDRPEIKSQSTGTFVNAIYQISKGCDK
jgi:hypothetical protein